MSISSVDGVYFNVRMEQERSCILIIIGADENGNKELVAVSDGYRESKISWKEILLDLKRRGLEAGPSLATGDGSLKLLGRSGGSISQDKERSAASVHKTAITWIRCQSPSSLRL